MYCCFAYSRDIKETHQHMKTTKLQRENVLLRNAQLEQQLMLSEEQTRLRNEQTQLMNEQTKIRNELYLQQTKRLTTLYQNLINQNRIDDLNRCLVDSDYREKLFNEFQLTNQSLNFGMYKKRLAKT